MGRRIRCSAPGRAGIIGNPSDMYGGSVISCTIQERATVTIEEADALIVECRGETLVVRSKEDLDIKKDYFDPAKAAIDCLELGHLEIKITCATAIPYQAGISGSTAVIVSILNGLLAWTGEVMDPFRRAEMARHIELNFMKMVCGYQDHYMCTFGGLNYMDFRDKEFYRSFGQEPYATVEPLADKVNGLPFVVAHTGIRHVSGAVHKPIRDRWLEGERKVVAGYLRIAHLARMGKKLMVAGDWEALGELMVENHEIQRDLGGSGPVNERLIRTALDCGALGAKLAGSGGGGTIIALHPEPEEMIEALKEAGADCILYPKPSPGVTVEELE